MKFQALLTLSNGTRYHLGWDQESATVIMHPWDARLRNGGYPDKPAFRIDPADAGRLLSDLQKIAPPHYNVSFATL